MSKMIVLVLCAISGPVVAHAQGPVGGSENPGDALYSTTTGEEIDRSAALRHARRSKEDQLIDQASSSLLSKAPPKQTRSTVVPAIVDPNSIFSPN